MNEQFLSDWLAPYIFSNVIAIILALMAWRKPLTARYLYAALFLAASIANTSMVLRNPLDYTNYHEFAWFVYRDFIKGPFVAMITPMILFIALGQLLIGIGFLFSGKLQKWAAYGAIFFFAAIIPLGLGSAFPFTIIAATGCYLLVRNRRSEEVSRVIYT